MSYIGARIFGFLGLVSFVAFLYGFFADNSILMILGGSYLVIENLMGILSGMLKPAVPIILAVAGAILVNPWYAGVFWSVAIFEFLNIPYNLKRMFSPESMARRM